MWSHFLIVGAAFLVPFFICVKYNPKPRLGSKSARSFSPIMTLKEAIAYANQLPQMTNISSKDSIKLSQTIRILGQNKQLGTALTLLQSASRSNFTLNAHHFGALLQACKISGQPDIAEALFERMTRSYSVERTTFLCNIMISIYADSGQPNKILEMMREMVASNIDLDAFTYSSAITGLSRCGAIKEAIQISSEAQNSSFMSNIYVMNAVLSAYANNRQWKDALQVFMQIDKLNASLDAVSFSIIISTLGEALQFSAAQRVFEAMTRAKVKRDVGVYNAILLACERSKQWKEAVAYVALMQEEGLQPDAITFCSAIAACGAAGRWKVCIASYLSFLPSL